MRLAVLVVVSAAFPAWIYVHFEHAQDRSREVVASALRDRDNTIAQILSPLLQDDKPPAEAVRSVLAQYSSNNTRRWLLYTPVAIRNAGGVQVAALSSWFPSPAGNFLDEAARLRIIAQLPDSCRRTGTQGGPPLGKPATPVLSVIPIMAAHGCWLLVSAVIDADATTTLARMPFWQIRDVHIAAAIYVLFVATMIFFAIGFVRGLRHFCNVAYDIGQHRTAIPGGSAPTVMGELSGAAEVLDGLALDIQRISNQIRQAAGDNAHSLKTPLAVVRAAVARVRRNSPVEQEQVHRALNAADQAIDRLFLIVTASQRLDDDNAALIVAPRRLMNMTRLVDDAKLQFADMLATRNIRLVCRLDADVSVRAGAGNLETVLRNALNNAINASPDGSTIFVTLKQGVHSVSLQIDDAGSSIGPDEIARVFERDYSNPASEDGPLEKRRADHVRPGLFVVKRNIEALGGQVVARNSPDGALSVIATLPRPRR